MAFKKGNKEGSKTKTKFSKEYQPPKENVGRPLKEIDEAKLIELAADDATIEEISSELDIDPSTLYARFSKTLKKGRDKGNISLKRRIRQKAMAGDTSALIWLTKVRCGYKEVKDEVSQGNTFNITVNELPK